MQGIQGDECVLGDAQFGEQRLGGGDLAGFLADLDMSEHQLVGVDGPTASDVPG